MAASTMRIPTSTTAPRRRVDRSARSCGLIPSSRPTAPATVFLRAIGMATQPITQAIEAAPLEVGVEVGEAGEGRDRDQEVAPGVADQALDLALVVAFAGPAEAVEEQIVRLQLGEGPGPLPLAIAQDARHRQPGVVVEDRARHATEEGERRVVPVEESLEPLGRVGLDKAGIRVRQVEAEEVDLAALAA